jgi:hypothetical protein
VLLKIDVISCAYFILDSKDYSAFPNEQEVLLFDGMKCTILDVKTEQLY